VYLQVNGVFAGKRCITPAANITLHTSHPVLQLVKTYQALLGGFAAVSCGMKGDMLDGIELDLCKNQRLLSF
jgi:hypothetical protein